MQAQFHPPERPSSSSLRSTSSRQAGTHDPLLPSPLSPLPQPGATQPRVTQSATGHITVEQQQAAQNGDFRAIASILNAILMSHNINAWVGEAGPGYLQITLTVKRPPKRQPLIRLISHQLYSLHSDVILGANLTVQVAQTNLILWHQLVRLPLPDIYKQPSRWQVWRDWLTTSTQSGWTHGRQQVIAWYQVAKNQPLWTPAPNENGTNEDGPDSSTNRLVRESGNEVGNVSGGGREPTHQPPAPSIPPDILLQAQQYAQQQTEKQAQIPIMQVKPVEAPELKNTPPLGDSWQQSWKRIQTTVTHQITHPSPWLLGGAAIAAFWLGSMVIESLIQSNSENDASRSSPLSHNEANNEAISSSTELEQTAPPQVSAVTKSPNHSPTPHSPTPHSPTPHSPTPHSPTPHSPSQRPKTISFNGQDIEVISLVPTTPSRSEVTLTFSNDAVVPLPSPKAETEGWQWPFSVKPAAPISHPADMAIAIFDTPLHRSSADEAEDRSSPEDTSLEHISPEHTSPEHTSPEHALASGPILTPQILRQGGIDVVNIAGNTIARTKVPSLAETLQLLEQAAIYPVGAGPNHEIASRPQVFDVKGHRIAILGYIDTYLYSADQDMAGNNPGTPRPLATDIEAIRDQVDWVIVTYHWHDILDTTPTQQQIKLAHLAVDQGADLVVGYHPGVMQGSEIYNGRAIAYSLGPLPTPPSQDPRGALSASRSADVKSSSESTSSKGLQLSSAGTSSSGSPSPIPLTAMLKVVLGDGRMGIEFVPVQPGPESSYVNGTGTQAVLRAVHSASESFAVPFPSNGIAHLSLEENIQGFSNSAEDTFHPNSNEPFIGNDDSE